MDRIIRLFGSPHDETQRLLPWYATGRIEPADRETVEAHLAECEACCAELLDEHRLKEAIASLPAAAADASWAAMRSRIEAGSPAPPRRGAALVAFRSVAGRPDRLGWFLAGQVALAALLALILMPMPMPMTMSVPAARYHALGASAAPPAGNLIIIFRPDAREQELRGLLERSRARIVDGPTASDAYVLDVPAADRMATLARLRAEPAVVLAEPIDGENAR